MKVSVKEYSELEKLHLDVTSRMYSDIQKLREEKKALEFRLGCSQEALNKTFNKLADEQQKLEAITKVVLDNSWIKLELGGKETYEEMLEALGIGQ